MTFARGLALVVTAVALVVLGLDHPPPDRTRPPTAREQAAVVHVPPEGIAQRAADAADEVALEQNDSTIGVEVFDRKTGELAGNAAAEQPQYSASMVKLIVAVDILRQNRADPSARELLTRALGPSDDEAMNELWTRFDGSGAVHRVTRELGLLDTRPPADPARWGESEVSARDIVSVFRYVLTEMDPADREFILASLRNAPTTATGGFDQGFGIDSLASGHPPAKAGWMCCADGELNLHSGGLLGAEERFVVAIVSTQPSSTGYDGGREVVSEAARALSTHLP